MGWTGTRNYYGSIDDFFENEFKSIKWVGKGALVKLKEYYRCAENEDGRRWVFVALMDFHKADGCDIFYKDMDESMNPFYYNCPARILELAEKSEPINECAKEWRKKVRKTLSNKEKAKSLEVGTVIKFPRTFRFSRAGEHDTFVVCLNPYRYAKRKTLWLKTTNGYYVSITNWRAMDFQIVGKQ